MPDLFEIDPEANVSLTDLRSEATVSARLDEYHRLALRRHGDLVGVLFDREAYRNIRSYVQQLERTVERLEESQVRQLIAQRLPLEDPVLLTDDALDDIEAQYRRLVSGE